MQPNNSSDYAHPINADTQPQYFLDDSIDASTDGDWWLDLGGVNLPTLPTV